MDCSLPRRLRLLVIVGATALVAVACSADGLDQADAPDRGDPSVPELGEPTAATAIDWEVCEEAGFDDAGLECGWLVVPVDHADPDGDTIDIAVARRPANDPAARIGPLVVNPGGPGVSGIDLARAWATSLPEPLLDRFDLVGFDPRGVGRSAPLRCLDDARKDAREADPLPPDEDGVDLVIELHREVGDGCVERHPQLVEHLSTADAATDMDLLRSALGEEQLSYLGVSYGTRLGAVYATMFPDRVRAAVLDAAVSPDEDPAGTGTTQAAGFEQVHASFIAACDADPDCPLGPDSESVLDGLRERLEAEPIVVATPTGDRMLHRAAFDNAVISAMYTTGQWGLLARAIDEIDGPGAATLLLLGDMFGGRSPDGTWNNQFEANIVINCSDTSERPGDVADGLADRQRMIDASPRFGPDIGWGVFACIGLPLAANPMPDVDGTGAAPILVIGGLDDPATPYRWAEELSEALASGVLVTWEGAGHGSFPDGGECVVATVSSYLIDLEVPDAGLRCPAEADQISFVGLEGQLHTRMTDSGLPADQAACAIDAALEQFGAAEFDLLMLTGADEVLDVVDDAVDACV